MKKVISTRTSGKCYMIEDDKGNIVFSKYVWGDEPEDHKNAERIVDMILKNLEQREKECHK